MAPKINKKYIKMLFEITQLPEPNHIASSCSMDKNHPCPGFGMQKSLVIYHCTPNLLQIQRPQRKKNFLKIKKSTFFDNNKGNLKGLSLPSCLNR
jgi:hypothetical protein